MLNPNGLMLDYYDRKSKLEVYTGKDYQEMQSKSRKPSLIENMEHLKTTKVIKFQMLDYYEGLREPIAQPVIRKSSWRPSDGDRKSRKLSMIVSNTQPVRAKYRKTSFAGYGSEVIKEVSPSESAVPSRKASIDQGRRTRRISRDANTIFASPHQSTALEICCEEEIEENQALFINSVKIPGSTISNPLQSIILRNYLALVALRKQSNEPRKKKIGPHKRYWSSMENEERVRNADSFDDMSSESEEDLEEVNDRLNKEIQRCYIPSKIGRAHSDAFDSGLTSKSLDLGKVYEDLQRSANYEMNSRRDTKFDEFIEMPEQIAQKRIKNREDNVMAPLSF